MLGAGCVVMAGNIVGSEVRRGVGCIVNCGAVVDYLATVENYDHLGGDVRIDGGTVPGRGSWGQGGAALGYEEKVPSGVTLPQ